MNTVLLVGLAIFLGTLTGRIFQHFKIPQVVGYIIVGVIIGKSFLHIFENDIVQTLSPLVNFTLGVIGAVIGSELKKSTFNKYGQSIYAMLLGEGMLAFLAVAAAVTALTGKLYLGLLLGAIASATDPASTTNVMWEYRARGPLTRTVTSIVALDDALALLIYGLVSVFAKAMIVKGVFSWWDGLFVPVFEILKGLGLGVACGFLVIRTIKRIREESMVLSFILSVIAIIVGLSVYLNLDLILSSMAFGMTIANIIPKMSEKLFGAIKEMTTSLYILFFVVVGTQLDIQVFLQVSILAIVLVYVLARSAGKIGGAFLGGIVSGAKKEVTQYAGVCLFTQGTVAMGLALSIRHNLSDIGPEGQQVGFLLVNVVAATTFIVQVIGPSLVKWGIIKADEAGRDVTRSDIIQSLKIGDVMQRKFSSIHEEEHLNDIIKRVREEETYNFPVVDRGQRLRGMISLRELKDALLEEDINEIILAEDIATPVRCELYERQPLAQAYEAFDKREIDFLPVIDSADGRKVVGILEYRDLVETVDRKLLEKQKGFDDGV